MKNQTCNVAISFFQLGIVSQFRAPVVFLSASDPAFTAVAWKKAVEEFGVRARTVLPYSPQASCRAERKVQTVRRPLARKRVADC